MATEATDKHVELDRYFPLTSEEQERLRQAQQRIPAGIDPNTWKAFAGGAVNLLLEAYQTGALDFRRMMVVMRGCALGCTTSNRVVVLGVLADKALAIDPASMVGAVTGFTGMHRTSKPKARKRKAAKRR